MICSSYLNKNCLQLKAPFFTFFISKRCSFDITLIIYLFHKYWNSDTWRVVLYNNKHTKLFCTTLSWFTCRRLVSDMKDILIYVIHRCDISVIYALIFLIMLSNLNWGSYLMILNVKFYLLSYLNANRLSVVKYL